MSVVHSFKLSDSFIEKFKGKQPNWGPLGPVVYYRTYSRVKEDGTNEEFYETLRRVVEGCFDIQKKHCEKLCLPWNNSKAQKTAQEMYQRMWDFKFLPPGRGLWMMGTKHVEKTSASLFNCAVVSTDNVIRDFAEPFCWAMEMLMLGCIASGTHVMTSEGPRQIQDLAGKPFTAVVDGKEYAAPKGSWKTGTKNVLNLKFRSGRSLTLTPDHKVQKTVLTRSNNITKDNISWVAASDLAVGDLVKLNNHSYYKWGGHGSLSEGYITGLVMGDGWHNDHTTCVAIHDNKPGKDSLMQAALDCLGDINRRDIAEGFRKHRDSNELTTGNWILNYLSKTPKKPLPSVEESSYDFHVGFLRGLFDTDGHVTLFEKKKTYLVGLTQACYPTMQLVQRMLLRLGINSRINKKRDPSVTTIRGRETFQQECWTLLITGENIFKFKEIIGFNNSPKKEKLESIYKYFVNRKPAKNYYSDEILSIDEAGTVDVYDISVPYAERFDAGGFVVHNCGVGFDSAGAGKITIKEPRTTTEEFIVPDTREGWVDALRVVLEAFAGYKALPVFNYSKVRQAGEPIKGFGGTASGPEPLKDLLERVQGILYNRVGQKLTVTDINDIFNFIGRCVVAGNVRRSSLLSLGEASDKEFMQLKDPVLHKEQLLSHRWSSNNSVIGSIGMDYTEVAKGAAVNGEPGIVWLDNLRGYGRIKDGKNNKDTGIVNTNPCGEIGLYSFEACNLVETFPAAHSNVDDFKETLKYAYLYSKTVTLIPTHSPQTNAVMQRNRRIGCSISGVSQALSKFGRRNLFDMLDKGYSYIEELDKLYSDWLCIPRSIKMTTVKPSGSISCLPGATPGMHYPHSEYYIRRVRMLEDSSLVKIYEKHGYQVEKDVYAPNTSVVSFPIKEENFDKSKADLTMWEQLELAANLQYYWADNSVSVTVTVKEEEKSQIKTALEYYETRLKSVSFLPLTDHKYAQAPYEEITKEQYEDMIRNITPITSYNITNNHETTEVFCSNDVCEIRPVTK
jgi:ribonucleoside-triphosphate reductase (thioredoxin)